ncbi:MAG: SPOR domain-containing protein [Neisseriaceae bacterium]|nr:SPOR domain-containing protein [Neisseriaceae bacterium]
MARRRSSRRRSSRGGGGNGIITGILIGMILAVGAVAVLMWYMNSQPNKLQQPQTQSQDPNEYQRPQRPATPVTTEIIRPQDAGVPPLQTEVVQETPAVPETTVAEDTAATDKTEKKEIAKKEEPKKANDDVLGEFIRKKDQEQAKKQPEKEKQDDLGNLIAKIDQEKQAKKKNQDDDDLGNLIGRIEQKNNNQQKQQTAQKSVFKPIVEGKSVVQAGSFATQEQAENQRAKLSMLGVSTHIETAVRDGKTYYRVRSGSIDTEQAFALKKRLAEQNTDSIVIPYR